jgi:hypothetical protein
VTGQFVDLDNMASHLGGLLVVLFVWVVILSVVILFVVVLLALKAPPAAPLNPLTANHSAAPSIAPSTATGAPLVTAPNLIEAKLIKSFLKRHVMGMVHVHQFQQ